MVLEEIKESDCLEDKKLNEIKCNTLWDRVYGWFKGLHYEGVEDFRARRDFKYLKEYGQDNLLRVLMKYPVFEYEMNLPEGKDIYCSRNWQYFMFLIDKAGPKKLPRKIDFPRPDFN